jgi:hypothetical protein
MLRIPHCIVNRLIVGGKVVSPMHQPHFTPQLSNNIFLLLQEGLGKLKKLTHIIGSRTCDLAACNIVFIVGECILLRMYQISKYRKPSFATVLQRALLYTYITTFWLIQSYHQVLSHTEY